MIPPSVRQSAQLLHRPVASTSSHIFKTTGSTLRHSSSTSGLPAFAPLGRTSADTLIPYGNPDQASSAYLPSLTGAVADPASLTTPLDLNAAQRLALERIIRVDQAGEVGANYIYKGQLAVLSRGKDAGVLDLVQHMWDGEKKHIATFDKLVTQHGVRPTFLYPVWKAAGFALGAGTALMGKRAAMACTEAVETIIGEHYDDQLKLLSNEALFPVTSPASSHPSITLLKGVLAEFRDDELEHLDTALKNESQQAPAHALLSAIIAVGCKVAIKATERI